MFDNYGNHQTVQPASPPPPKKVVRFDRSFIHTTPGILKLVQILCNMVGFICIKISWSWISSIFYNILYWVGNIITVSLLLSYMFHIVEKYDHWPWLKLEFSYCCIMSITYLGCSIFAATIGENVGYAVTFFGLCAIIAYGLDGYLKYKALKRGLPPQ